MTSTALPRRRPVVSPHRRIRRAFRRLLQLLRTNGPEDRIAAAVHSTARGGRPAKTAVTLGLLEEYVAQQQLVTDQLRRL